MKNWQCALISVIVASISVNAKEITFDSYKESCNLIAKSPISLENAYSIAFNKLSEIKHLIKQQKGVIGISYVRTIGNEYFFPLRPIHKYKKRKEFGIYVSAINGRARFVWNESNTMVSPITLFDTKYIGIFKTKCEAAINSAASNLKHR